ncbi:MAG TPA: zinc-dependent metalloprotease family protein [Pseudomonadales bacterium]|nr:zinc-dependent metalloprotease family protein [Pseudomonadales bacterium]
MFFKNAFLGLWLACLLSATAAQAQADDADMLEPPFVPPVPAAPALKAGSPKSMQALGAPTVNEIRVLFLYTPDAVRLYGSTANLQTRISNIVAYANTVYSNSGVQLHMNIADEQLLQYDNNNVTSTALSQLANKTHPAFAGVNLLRMQSHADFVVLLRPQKSDTAVCGLAYANGAGVVNPESNFWTTGGYAYSHVYINCPDFVLVHELGHNMGLVHSRTDSTANAGKVYPYGAGYRIAGDFSTVMAGTPATLPLPYFSSPSYNCTGSSGVPKPCGIDSAQSNGADAVLAINNIAAQLPHLSDDSDGDGMPDWFENFWGFDRFNPADAAQDADGDGRNNLQEFYAETYPAPNSTYAISLSQARDTDGDGISDGIDPYPTIAGNPVLELNGIYRGSSIRELIQRP